MYIFTHKKRNLKRTKRGKKRKEQKEIRVNYE